MNFFTLWKHIFSQKTVRKTLADYKHDMLTTNAREQFQYLLKKHLQVPVALL